MCRTDLVQLDPYRVLTCQAVLDRQVPCNRVDGDLTGLCGVNAVSL